jgi:hypothetical protein
MPEANTLNGIQKSIDDFVIDKLKVARNRLFFLLMRAGSVASNLTNFLPLNNVFG